MVEHRSGRPGVAVRVSSSFMKRPYLVECYPYTVKKTDITTIKKFPQSSETG
jgi:hypothetical protein